MHMKRIAMLGAVVMLIMGLAAPALAGGGPPPKEGDGPGNRVRVVVYVESQGLFFESIVGPNLPPNGPFQQLRPGEGPGGALATEFGPGDPGYLGGRWWVDANGSGEMDEGDAFFSCPLLGHGSATPSA
jgi:hypothetical protein